MQHRWSSRTLTRIRQLSLWLGAGLALCVLALVLSAYEGLQHEFTTFLNASVGERLNVSFDFTRPDQGIEQVLDARPEGLNLLQSPYIDSYTDSDESISLRDQSPQPQIDLAALQKLPAVQAVSWVSFEPQFGASASVNLPVKRVPTSYFAVERLSVAQGRLPTVAEGADAVVIGARTATYLLGDQDPIGAVITTNMQATPIDEVPAIANLDHQANSNNIFTHPYTFTVVGVLAPVDPQRNVFDRLNDATIFLVDDTLPEHPVQISVLPRPGQAQQAEMQIRTLLAPQETAVWKLGIRSDRETYEYQIVRQFQQVTVRGLSWIIGLAIGLAFLTVGIGAYLDVMLQRRNIGIQRSLGAPRRTIMVQYLRAGLKVAAVGGGIGLIGAWALQPLAVRAGQTIPRTGWLTLSSVVIVALLMGVGAYLFASRQIVRLQPAQAFREATGRTLQRRRWAWGGPGIALSLLALILILALREGLRARIDSILGWTGAQTIAAVSWPQTPDPFDQPAYLTIEDYDAVKAEFPRWQVAYMGDIRYTAVEVSQNLPDVLPVTFACGRWFNAEEFAKPKQVLVLGYERAAKIARERKLAGPCAVTQWRNTPVVGILGQWDASMAQGYSPMGAYFPIGARITPSLDDPTTVWDWNIMRRLQAQLIVQVPPDEDLGQAAERLRAFLTPRHPEGIPQLILPAGVTQDLLDRRNQIYTLAGVMALLCLLIGGIGLLNLTFISVLSRAREIGVRRALGATKRRILGQILGEVVRLCLGAALLGAAAGLAIARVLQVRFGWPPTTPWELIALAAGLAVLVGLAAGILPAWWAANLPPTRAIKSE